MVLKHPQLTAVSLFIGFGLLGVACQKDEPAPPSNEQELITTVTLTFVETGTNISSVAAYSDPDGPGGAAPTVQPVTLKAGSTYVVTVAFLDASDPGNVDDITEEVKRESAEHLVCYAVSGAIPAPVVTDQDSNGDPLGVVTSVAPATPGAGALTVILKHEPDKGAANPCATGETDVETTPAFPVTVQ